EPAALALYEAARAGFGEASWQAVPILAEGIEAGSGEVVPVTNPARTEDRPGEVHRASEAQARAAIAAARPWDAPVAARAAVLESAARLYEANAAEIHAIVAREAGKTMADAVAELR